MVILHFDRRRAFAFRRLEPKTGCLRRLSTAITPIAEGDMTINRALVFSILMSAIAVGCAGPAMAQACTLQGIDVSCDDGRRGLLSGDAIIWPDGTRSSLSPHPSVIIGNKSSVRAVSYTHLRAHE